MRKIRVGIVGMGYIGESHIDAVRRIGDCVITAVADTNYELAKAKAEKYGIENCYASVEELIADKNIDAVHNCTPNYLHFDINRQIIESGKHLLSEKPLTCTYKEALELLAVAAKMPEVVAAVNFNYRMNPMVQEMRYRIARGDIGDVRIISGSYLQDWLLYDTDYSWRLEPEIAGNSCTIADIGSHWMDAVQHVTGNRITEVMADLVTFIPYRKKPKKLTETFTTAQGGEYELCKIENEDYGAVLFKTDTGAHGCFYVSELCAGHGCCFEFEINGSKASLRWNQEENDRLWMGLRDADNRYIIRNPNSISPGVRPYTSLAMGHPEGWNDAFCGNIRAFYNYILSDRKERPPFATLEEAAYIVRLVEAVIESSRKKAWVKV
ncbi:MAG: Gfo/Idh/MocA family oxidoreductase [Clostridiales bacterium]|nr:Gfo/Idh/MocA family oxidoreductase [Clostridiales bacterium]